MTLHDWIIVPWIAFGAYWLISALKTRATVRRESFFARYGVMLVEVIGFTLVFSSDLDGSPLGRHFLPHTSGISVLGIVLTWLGVGIAIWARYHLGQFWSGRITLKEGHQLIRTGPYARLRHPIYTGLDLAAIGSALVIDRWRCVAGVCVIMLGFIVKAKREEALLAGQFGEAFEEHRKLTGFLLPRL
ncbi:MAG TPA: isoprenylcysteine carboxylmethyltransferase family protein [Candidatus Sulfotelmatobacter sp.]|nr:isoprenylcysteine carboxylmethyltransferase family protein [Candidatus Sulfotelmatobacter sp.]